MIQVLKITRKDKHRTATGWPQHLSRGGRLIQVTNTAFYERKIGALKTGRYRSVIYYSVGDEMHSLFDQD